MRVMIVDWDRDAICQFEKQCEEILNITDGQAHPIR
jgi:hypothetical protein